MVPVRAGEKKPCVKWKPYRNRRPNVDELQARSERWSDAGTAVVLGPVSSLFVIDVDRPETHAALVERLGAVLNAPLAASGSRAPYRYHLYFRHPDSATTAKATPWHPKLEFRGAGGLVVAPPSPHASGRRYAWALGRSPDEMSLPELPPFVLASLTRHLANTRAAVPHTQAVLAPGPRPAGVSDSTRELLSGKWAEGSGWNDRLFWAACDLLARGVPEPEAIPLLLAGARPWDDKQAALALATIHSAHSQRRAPAKV